MLKNALFFINILKIVVSACHHSSDSYSVLLYLNAKISLYKLLNSFYWWGWKVWYCFPVQGTLVALYWDSNTGFWKNKTLSKPSFTTRLSKKDEGIAKSAFSQQSSVYAL